VLTRRIAKMTIDELLLEGKVELQISAVDEIQAILDRLTPASTSARCRSSRSLREDRRRDVQRRAERRSDRERRISKPTATSSTRSQGPRRERARTGSETYRTEQINRAKA